MLIPARTSTAIADHNSRAQFFVLPPPPAASQSKSVDPRIAAALGMLASDLERPPNIKRIAALLRLSVRHFERLFKRETGQSVRSFLLATRMARAKRMLQGSPLLVKEVAAALGYRDKSDFTRDFRKQCGFPPSRSRSRLP